MYELQLQTPQHHQILQAVDATGLWTPPGCGRHRAVDATRLWTPSAPTQLFHSHRPISPLLRL